MILSRLEAEFLRQIRRYVKPNMTLIAAVSGGSDSICLLTLLERFSKTLSCSLVAVHLNHGLRPEADAEEEFVRQFCEERNIPLEIRHADIQSLSREKKISEELCGRQERYAFFEELREKYQADWIVTAHHRDDQTETVLMHLIRGCGLDGLSGIRECSGRLLRPLLPYSKADLLAYLNAHSIPFVTDQSNFSDRYFRNKIRLQLIPLLEELNPNISENISNSAKLFSEDSAFLLHYAEEKFRNAYTPDGLLRNALQNEPLPIRRRMLQLFYRKSVHAAQNLSVKQIDAMLALQKSGQKTDLPGGYCCWCDYHTLTIQKQETRKAFFYPISENIPCRIAELGKTVLLRRAKTTDTFRFILKSADHLAIRTRKNGDSFYPAGMTGRKKLSDFFSDEKIPYRSRDEIPVLVQNNDIIAIIGLRQDRRFLKNNQNETKYEEYTLEIWEEKC